MNTLKTDKKYTIILSAYNYDNLLGLEENMILTERMFDNLENRIHVHAIRAVGVYEGACEQSFVIHTNSANTMGELRRLALDVYHQKCILVSHNRKHEIKLHCANCENVYVGTHFVHSPIAFKKESNYTILNGKDYYVVR